MEIICYGCGRGQYIENTLGAIESCHIINPEWWIEIDIQLTNDLEIVLFHDKNMSHLCGIDAKVSDLPWGKIKEMEISIVQLDVQDSRIIVDCKIPRFSDVLSQTNHRKFIVDISTTDDRIVEVLSIIIIAYKGKKEFIIVSEHDHLVNLVKERLNWVSVGAGASEAKALIFGSKLGLDRFFELKADILLMPEYLGKIKLLSQRVIDHVHDRGKKVFIWKQERPIATCFNDKTELERLEKMGVDGIFTDQPEKLLKSFS